MAVGIGSGVGSGAPRLPAAMSAGSSLRLPHTRGLPFGVESILLVSDVRVPSELTFSASISDMLPLSVPGNGTHTLIGRLNW